MTGEKRQYKMRRRAELEAQTRLRITESAMALHGTLGPARTSISAVAEHAGVQRSTIYRHFPSEEALFSACSAHWAQENPLPNLERWGEAPDPDERLALALRELYAFYRGSEAMIVNLLRDRDAVPIVGQLMGAYDAYLDTARETLLAGRGLRGRAKRRAAAALGHAVEFPTWRSLVRVQGMDDAGAAELMTRLVAAAQLP